MPFTRIICAAVLGIALITSGAQARKMVANGAVQCNDGMQENVNLSVNFNISAKSFSEAKVKFDEKMKQIETFAKQQEIKRLDVNSLNYNINAQQITDDNGSSVPGYQLHGNTSYQLDSSDSAFRLGEFLTQKKFQVSVNVNKYRNNMCNQTGGE